MSDVEANVNQWYDELIRSEFLAIVEDPRIGGRFSEDDRERFRRLAASAPLDVLGHNLFDLPEGPWEPDAPR